MAPSKPVTMHVAYVNRKVSLADKRCADSPREAAAGGHLGSAKTMCASRGIEPRVNRSVPSGTPACMTSLHVRAWPSTGTRGTVRSPSFVRKATRGFSIV